MLELITKNPKITTLIIFVISIVIILVTSIAKKRATDNNEEPSSIIKGFNTIGWIIFILCIIAIVILLCSDKDADCLKWFLIFNLFKN